MKSLVINPVNKKEFETALALLPEFGKERNLLTLEDDDEISFVCLINIKNTVEENPIKGAGKKPSR